MMEYLFCWEESSLKLSRPLGSSAPRKYPLSSVCSRLRPLPPPRIPAPRRASPGCFRCGSRAPPPILSTEKVKHRRWECRAAPLHSGQWRHWPDRSTGSSGANPMRPVETALMIVDGAHATPYAIFINFEPPAVSHPGRMLEKSVVVNFQLIAWLIPGLSGHTAAQATPTS